MYHGGIEQDIVLSIERSLKRVLADLNINPPSQNELKIELEIPKEKSHGDLATNIAMKASRLVRQPPIEFAGLISSMLEKEIASSGLKEVIQRVETKPPGFINFFFTKSHLYRVLSEIRSLKDNFGKIDIGKGEKVQVEFVSANPTGPLTIAHARQAAIGDSLANIMGFLGYKVTREYYLNDEGTQVDILASSIKARYKELCGAGADFPENGYKGSYIQDIAKDLKKKYGTRLLKEEAIDNFREFGLGWILKDIKNDLKGFGVKFDVWYSQKGLRKSGKVEKALSLLKAKGYIYEQEGAVWFKSTEFGDDKDRVVIKSDGSTTYLAPDIAYHLEKYKKGFSQIIDIWGPDHHGYIPRMKAAVAALGFPKESLSILIVQLATLYRNGQAVSMSTRAGEFITLREVIDEVGKDVSRFCFLMRRVSSHLDFDLDAVKKESSENPVYYIQYAHARIWSILKHSGMARIGRAFNPGLLKEEEELAILRLMRQFPLIISSSGKAHEPYIILQYLQDLATIFHSFYTKHRVVGDCHALTKARLALVDSARIVLANGLRLLGVSLPKKM